MKILAFGASNSLNSINKMLAMYATTFFDGSDIEILDLNDFEMTLFSVDKENMSGHPEEAHRFHTAISHADLLIISMAEHNGSYTVAFKNILDWASRINGKVFQDKPMLLLSTSTGARGAKSVLEAAKTRFPFHAANIIDTFSLPEFNKNFSASDGITNPDLKEAFLTVIQKTKSQFSNTGF
jgi:chromate reductase, NAD(P)H dehydrogenase (quinone)